MMENPEQDIDCLKGALMSIQRLLESQVCLERLTDRAAMFEQIYSRVGVLSNHPEPTVARLAGAIEDRLSRSTENDS